MPFHRHPNCNSIHEKSLVAQSKTKSHLQCQTSSSIPSCGSKSQCVPICHPTRPVATGAVGNLELDRTSTHTFVAPLRPLNPPRHLELHQREPLQNTAFAGLARNLRRFCNTWECRLMHLHRGSTVANRSYGSASSVQPPQLEASLVVGYGCELTLQHQN